MAGVLLVIEQEPVLDGDDAGRGVDVEAAAGVVDQRVGEGRTVRIDRGDGADDGAVVRILGAASLPVTPVGATLPASTVR